MEQAYAHSHMIAALFEGAIVLLLAWGAAALIQSGGKVGPQDGAALVICGAILGVLAAAIAMVLVLPDLRRAEAPLWHMYEDGLIERSSLNAEVDPSTTAHKLIK